MNPVQFIGLDIHADTIAVAVAGPSGTIGNIGQRGQKRSALAASAMSRVNGRPRSRTPGNPPDTALDVPLTAPLSHSALDTALIIAPAAVRAWAFPSCARRANGTRGTSDASTPRAD